MCTRLIIKVINYNNLFIYLSVYIFIYFTSTPQLSSSVHLHTCIYILHYMPERAFKILRMRDWVNELLSDSGASSEGSEDGLGSAARR